ncbi:MAG: adenine phosphoribosyltransferase [Blastocatellia bacterium]|nr:adenine phosphoribosyltransferase [Blastocatellia bacterium]MCS7156502.1 adenine phosphoribosyltransferase [Blastocatellia bacterium]MCX7751757.1 adenine phosphoribosyltransferase [Blastocatellia bacterium]MDW8168858.1 adenine phosphoribosyltransferase [Acidobacteriota bacterium]MDW8256619.1 adenine phosphoribosyltransferase [Acidobacteriota bacterium]
MEKLKRLIREIPDFPKPGILFYDITTLLKDPEGFRTTVDLLSEAFAGERVDRVVGIEARGFIFAPALAYKLGAGFIPMRKSNKLPAPTESVTYTLEYGTDRLEIHKDAIEPGHRVLIIDDLLATGGTAKAAIELVEKLGGQVIGVGFVIELEFLKGRERLAGYRVVSLLKYPS